MPLSLSPSPHMHPPSVHLWQHHQLSAAGIHYSVKLELRLSRLLRTSEGDPPNPVQRCHLPTHPFSIDVGHAALHRCTAPPSGGRRRGQTGNGMRTDVCDKAGIRRVARSVRTKVCGCLLQHVCSSGFVAALSCLKSPCAEPGPYRNGPPSFMRKTWDCRGPSPHPPNKNLSK